VLAQITNAPAFWQFLHYSKDAFSAIESAVKVLAFIVAGYWTYRLFVKKRETFPRAKLRHTISFWEQSQEERIVRVALAVENDSDVLLKIPSGYTWLQQMKPWPVEEIKGFRAEQDAEMEASHSESGPDQMILSKGTEIRWPLIAERNFRGEREVEPKESDEGAHLDTAAIMGG
jgi:hypothetical protein